MDDIGFKTDSGKFRLRGVGIVIKDGCVLMVHDEKRGYYYPIGGAVRIGESTEEAAVREVFEESGLKVNIDRLLLVQENFFDIEDELHHEIAFCYLMKDIGDQELSGDRVLDYSAEGLAWLQIERFHEYKAYPEIYGTLLKDLPSEITHIVVNDSKKGDPS